MSSASVPGTGPQPIDQLTTRRMYSNNTAPIVANGTTATSGTSGVSGSSSGSASSNAAAGVSVNEFLTLLTTELQNQDPTQPQDPTESVTQLAQFSQLQYEQQLSQAFTNFQSNFGVMQSASLIGKQATVVESSSNNAQSSTVSGTISSISVQNGQPYFTMTNSSGQTITSNTGTPLLFSFVNVIGIANGS